MYDGRPENTEAAPNSIRLVQAIGCTMLTVLEFKTEIPL